MRHLGVEAAATRGEVITMASVSVTIRKGETIDLVVLHNGGDASVEFQTFGRGTVSLCMPISLWRECLVSIDAEFQKRQRELLEELGQ
jgi:hypothetical protein